MSDDRKPSWKEIDQMRDGTRSGERNRPKGKAAEERSQQATQQYLKEIDKLFSASGGGSEADALVKRLRDAHGTPELPEVCRAFREEVGLPRDASLLSIFLDSNQPDLVVDALGAILALLKEGELEMSKGMLSQLRVLAEDFNNDIAEVAEEILADFG
jgi:hypothetical protein